MGPRHTSPPGHQSWAIKGHPQGDGHENQVRALDVCGNSPVGGGAGGGAPVENRIKEKNGTESKENEGWGMVPTSFGRAAAELGDDTRQSASLESPLAGSCCQTNALKLGPESLSQKVWTLFKG